MGGGPDPEHLVIALWSPTEPTDTLTRIRTRFPYIRITYLNLGDHTHPYDPATSPPIDPAIYASATIWVTLGILPPSPEVVPKLKLIHLFSAGVDHFASHPILKGSDIVVTTSSGISAPPIAEWVLMTALAATKRFATTSAWQGERRWGPNGSFLTEGRDWVGKTVGVAGYGSIGRQVARHFHSLGSRILAYTASPRPTSESRIDKHSYLVPGSGGDPDGLLPTAWYSGTGTSDLHAFLSSGIDLLVICLPLTPATEHSIGAAEFKVLADGPKSKGWKPYVANISRGKIIRQGELVEALNGEVLAGAMLDVTDPEPLPEDDPLWGAKNVIITPHVSSLGVEYVGRAYDVLVENLQRKEEGRELLNVVRREKGY